MRVNVYAEEMTNRVEIISKEIDGHAFTGLRLYLELPVTTVQPTEGCDGAHVSGPFMHRPGDDDSSAVTFWGKRDLRVVLRKMLAELDAHYDAGRQAATEGLVGEDERLAREFWTGWYEGAVNMMTREDVDLLVDLIRRVRGEAKRA